MVKLRPLRSIKPVEVRRRFWSITMYNEAGYMEKNDKGFYSFNNVTAKKNADGSITNNFGCEPSALNNLPITPGWNYTDRIYQPRQDIIDGSWKFPKPLTVESAANAIRLEIS